MPVEIANAGLGHRAACVAESATPLSFDRSQNTTAYFVKGDFIFMPNRGNVNTKEHGMDGMSLPKKLLLNAQRENVCWNCETGSP